MADQLDNRPVFTMVMGCDGAGKTHWKRANYDLLPLLFMDVDSLAGGLGDWNEDLPRKLARSLCDQYMDEAVADRRSFGIENSYSSECGLNRVARMRDAGYRIEGIYLAMNSPELHMSRIDKRVFLAMGHRVDVELIPERYRASLSNLCLTAEWFDDLELLDNTPELDVGYLEPRKQAVLERGKLVYLAKEPVNWATDWLNGLQERQRHLVRNKL